MAATNQEWLPGNIAPDRAQDQDHNPGEVGHQETPDSWRRRAGRLSSTGRGWSRGGRLVKVVYWWYYTNP